MQHPDLKVSFYLLDGHTKGTPDPVYPPAPVRQDATLKRQLNYCNLMITIIL